MSSFFFILLLRHSNSFASFRFLLDGSNHFLFTRIDIKTTSMTMISAAILYNVTRIGSGHQLQNAITQAREHNTRVLIDSFSFCNTFWSVASLGKRSIMRFTSSWRNWWWHKAPKADSFSHLQIFTGPSTRGGYCCSSLLHATLKPGKSKLGHFDQNEESSLALFHRRRPLGESFRKSWQSYVSLFWHITGPFCSESFHDSHLFAFSSFTTSLTLSRHWTTWSDGYANLPK